MANRRSVTLSQKSCAVSVATAAAVGKNVILSPVAQKAGETKNIGLSLEPKLKKLKVQPLSSSSSSKEKFFLRAREDDRGTDDITSPPSPSGLAVTLSQKVDKSQKGKILELF